MSNEWWRTLYARQHEVWPGWSASDGGAPGAMGFVHQLVGQEPGRVLDVGCGVGRELIALGKLGWSGLGLDISAQLVSAARRRLTESHLDGPLTVVRADLRSWQPNAGDRYDLVLCWDSVLAIWAPDQQQELVGRMAGWLKPGARLIVGQLCHEHFRSVRQLKSSLQGNHIGPGKTERTYHFDPAEGVLEDRVVWHPEDGGPEPLPTQRLHLLSATRGVKALQSAGLVDVSAVGSEGWTWEWPGRRPPDADSRQVVLVGRAPPDTTS